MQKFLQLIIKQFIGKQLKYENILIYSWELFFLLGHYIEKYSQL